MKQLKLENSTVEQLVGRFAAICLDQDQALLYSEIAKFNQLYGQMVAVREELKRRPGDQRRALLALYDHENAQVRLQAARASLAVAPDAARKLIETIAKSRTRPQAGDAGMTISNLDRGYSSRLEVDGKAEALPTRCRSPATTSMTPGRDGFPAGSESPCIVSTPFTLSTSSSAGCVRTRIVSSARTGGVLCVLSFSPTIRSRVTKASTVPSNRACRREVPRAGNGRMRAEMGRPVDRQAA